MNKLILCKNKFFFKLNPYNKIGKSYYFYLIKLYCLLLVLFSFLRICFIIYHLSSVISIDITNVSLTFIIGLLFDSVVVSSTILLIIFLTYILQFVFKGLIYNIFYFVTNVLIGFFLFINIIDIFYFNQYGTRINSLIFEATQETNTIIITIWKIYPVIKIILFFIVVYIIFNWLHKKIFKKFLKSVVINSNLSIKWLIASLIFFASLSFLYYGPPLWTISEFSSSSVLNQASMNGVYCLIKSFHQKIIYKTDLPSYNYFEKEIAFQIVKKNIVNNNDSLIKNDFIFLRQFKQNSDSNFAKKNIVIIIMESFGSKYIGCLNNGVGFSQSFDSISKNGILFTNFIANGPRTQNGVISTISGFPSILGVNIQRRKGLYEFQTLGNILLSKGYNTNFIHNGRASYDDLDKFMRQGGFLNQIDVKDFKTWQMKNEWGVSDEDLYEKALQYIWANNNVPTLSVILTMTNHAPYELPVEFKMHHSEINKMSEQQAAFYYSDYALGKFIRKCSKNKNYMNTVFYILADHSDNFGLNCDEVNIFRIPLLILNSKQNCGRINKVASQCDLPSTILSELNYKGKYHFIGQDIFASNYKPFAYARDYNNNLYLFEDSVILKYNLESNLFKNIVGSINVKTENVDFLKCYIQTITYIFRNGKYRYDVK